MTTQPPPLTISNRAEYALYWLAVNHPDVWARAQRWSGVEIAGDQPTLRAVKHMLSSLPPQPQLGPEPPAPAPTPAPAPVKDHPHGTPRPKGNLIR